MTALPAYILLEVFEYLPGADLAVAANTCSLWRSLIRTRRRLRAHCFLGSPSAASSPAYSPRYRLKDTELHPVLSLLHFDNTVDPLLATYGCRSWRRLLTAPWASQPATCPPLTTLRLDVMKYHPHLVVNNPHGVTLRDVVRELAD